MTEAERIALQSAFESTTHTPRDMAACGLTGSALAPVAAALSRHLAGLARGGAGRTHVSVAALREVAPDAAAAVALVACLDGVARAEALAHIAERAGGRIDGLRRGRGAGWSRSRRARVGATLVNAVLLGAGDIFETYRGHGELRLGLTPATAAAAAGGLGPRCAAAVHEPMVAPPRPWTDFDTGAYLTPAARHGVTLVRLRDATHLGLLRRALRADRTPRLFAAVNAIQAVPWRINPAMLALVETARDHDPRLLAPARVAVPPRPAAATDADAWTAWRREAARAHDHNRRADAQGLVLARDLGTARRLLAAGNRFWVPHSLDFRGRIYPIPAFNQQRGDAVRALFDFADGVPLGPAGLNWLAVHVANCGDFDRVAKASFDDRLAWVRRHLDAIAGVAADPAGTVGWWGGADAPFQFVRACIELTAALAALDPAAFVSHLPVALDGSSSGLQHYAAALRDAEGAAGVNLMARPAPADIYQDVADRVAATVARDAAAGVKEAVEWRDFGVTRATVKRAVMTSVYSAEAFGFRRQIMADTMRPLEAAVVAGARGRHPFAEGGWPAAGYLAGLLGQTVAEVAAGAGAGMAFLRRVAGVAAGEGQGLTWTTPLGLPVRHHYRRWRDERVTLHFLDPRRETARAGDARVDGRIFARVTATLRARPTRALDRARQLSAVAPNVIHSMDASHLMLTVLAAGAAGIRDYALIHDSFGAHAGLCTAWSALIRQAFVDLYAAFDPCAAVRQAAWDVLSPAGRAALPPLPARGSLDLAAILGADYAFA